MSDPINPDHYRDRDGSQIDCSAAQKAGLGLGGYRSYLAGCAAKYLWRFESKNGVEDLRKCIQVLHMLKDTYLEGIPQNNKVLKHVAPDNGPSRYGEYNPT